MFDVSYLHYPKLFVETSFEFSVLQVEMINIECCPDVCIHFENSVSVPSIVSGVEAALIVFNE